MPTSCDRQSQGNDWLVKVKFIQFLVRTLVSLITTRTSRKDNLYVDSHSLVNVTDLCVVLKLVIKN